MTSRIDGALVVRSSVTVRLDREAAFRLFTERMAEWWPLASHSVYDDPAAALVVEPRVGGRVLERASDGRECAWGTITDWEVGRRLGMTWFPGMDEALSTQVDVRFSDAPQGGTQVDLVHVGWEARGAEAAERAASYQSGWGIVLGKYAAMANR